MNIKTLASIFILLLTVSCSKILVKPNIADSPQKTFNQLWGDINDKYVFFEYKNINWDSVKQVYEPLIYAEMENEELYDVLGDMILTLRDGHTSIYTPFDTCKYYFYKGVSNNFNSNFVLSTYLEPNNVKTTESIKHCLLNNSIAYLYYPSFKNDLTQEGMNEILGKYSSTNGLILDLRDNTGGSNDNIYRLFEHFISSDKLCGYFQEKVTNVPNAYTEPKPINIVSKGISYTKPIVVLTNRKVYSSANIFTGFMAQLPNVKVIGDITGGGCGLPTSNQLPNGWLYRFSSSYITFENGELFENGIIPDINVSTDSISEMIGVDLILERALQELQ